MADMEEYGLPMAKITFISDELGESIKIITFWFVCSLSGF